MIRFQENLKNLLTQYTQRYIADKTSTFQSSINAFLTDTIKPSMQFLVA